MKYEYGKIVEATRAELYRVWLRSGWCETMSFPDYMRACIEDGTRIVDIGEGSDF